MSILLFILMKKYRLYLLIALLAGLVILAFFPIRSYYLFLKEPISPVDTAIPASSAIIVKSSSLNKLITIIQTSEIFKILEKAKSTFGIRTLSEKITEISAGNSFFAEVANEKEVIICIVPDSLQAPEMLFLAGIGKSTPNEIRRQVKNLLPDGINLNKVSGDLFSISIENQEIWFWVHRGILAIAFKREIIDQSIAAAAKKQTLIDDQCFARLAKTSGKNVDGVLMLNNLKLAEVFLQSTENNPFDFAGSPINAWTSLDLHFEQNRVLMDGFTCGLSDTTILSDQEPGETSHLKLLPKETAFVISLSVSDQKLYSSRFFLKDTLQLIGYDSANRTTSKEIFRKAEHLRAWIGNTVSLVALPRFFKGNDSARIIMVGIKNQDSTRILLRPYLKPFNGEIKILTATDLPQHLWGSLFATGHRAYCLISDQNLIISPTAKLLEDYENDRAENQLFGTTETYKELAAIMLEKSSITILAIPEQCIAYLKESISKEARKNSSKWSQVPASSRLICMQYSAGEPFLFTHAVAILNKTSDKTSENEVGRDDSNLAESESASNKKPGNQNDEQPTEDTDLKSTENAIKANLALPVGRNTAEVIFTIYKNTLTAFSKKGDKRWSFECKGKPVPDIYEIELNGQRGTNYLVGTDTHLHLLDQSGKELKNSPVKIPSGNTCNIALLDYDNNKDYRVLYRGNDGLLHNITIKGNELPDWRKPSMKDKLSGPVQFIRTGGKDYLVFTDIKGRISIVDRRGRERVKVSDSFRISAQSDLFENRTNNKGIFLMASASGNLVYIDGNEKISESNFGDFGSNPWFNYLDFDLDGSKDFMFCGNGKVVVFSKMKKEIASAKLTAANFSKPFIYKSAKESWVAVRDIKSSKVVAFNNKNEGLKIGNISSEADPVIITRKGEKNPTLVTIINNKLVFNTLK